jgi:hypothetical protein
MTAPATSSSCWSDDASSVQLLIASPSPSSPQQKRHWRQQIVPTAPFLRNDNDDDDDADGLLRSVSDNLCHVEYCPCPVAAEGGKSGIGGGGLLKIVSSDDTRTVLDVIDVDDVIGASIEVHWNDATAANDDATAGISSSSSPRSTADDPRALPRAGAGPKPSSPPPQPGETLVDRQAHATLHIYCYPKTEVKRSPSFFQRFLGLMSSSPLPPQNSPPQPRAAAHRSLVLAPAEDLGGAQALVRSIRTAARYHPHQGQGNESIIDSGNIHVLRRERYLVLVNPVSGKGQAPKEAREVVVPMLEQAGIDHVVVETRYAGHAAEIVREKVIESNTREHSDTDAVTAILVVGGDGVYHECVNTLASHSHRRKEEDDDEIVPWLRQIKLGMVPCGTGSGLAASVAHASEEDCNVISCCFLAWCVRVCLFILSFVVFCLVVLHMRASCAPVTVLCSCCCLRCIIDAMVAIVFSDAAMGSVDALKEALALLKPLTDECCSSTKTKHSKGHVASADTSLYTTLTNTYTSFLTFSW